MLTRSSFKSALCGVIGVLAGMLAGPPTTAAAQPPSQQARTRVVDHGHRPAARPLGPQVPRRQKMPMRRDLDAFHNEFDVLVVGGGIYGACIARFAARHGWSVALLERGDFGAGVSHNSLRIVHSGLRYVQHFDVPRIRQSAAAQRAWLRAAPHLVRPMRCVIPTYGYGTRGALALVAGSMAFHTIAGRRNADLSPAARLPLSGLMSRSALLRQYPDLTRLDVTGGAYWYDAQILDANRLTIECIQDACRYGAVVANHVEALRLRAGDARVDGVIARDALTGREFDIRARVTVNATGPRIERLLNDVVRPLKLHRPLTWTRNVNLVTPRVFDTADAVGVGSQRVSDAAVGRSKRLFFVTPWQDCSIIGTSHIQHAGDIEDLVPAVRTDVDGFLREVNDALPRLGLQAGDIRYVHSGLTPAEDEIQRSRRSILVDHASVDGVRGLVSVLGVKYTTAPIVAGRVIAAIAQALGEASVRVDLSSPLPGWSPSLALSGDESEDAQWAMRIYGARAPDLFRSLPRGSLSAEEHVFRCRIQYGLENEMVVRLQDALFRASDAAERGHLTAERLAWCSALMAQRFGWSAERRDLELRTVCARQAGMLS
jgi:glycerol-3-phosphate dehydrogenase